MKRRVVITGVGTITALGNDTGALWQGLLDGRSGLRAHTFEGIGEMICGRADDPDAESAFGRKDARRMDRAGRFASLAAAEALQQAGDLALPREAVGAAVACCHGGAETLAVAAQTLRDRGVDKVSPLAIPLALTNSPVAATARIHDLKGPSLNPGTACASGSDAIGQAAGLIRSGRADAMVAGGTEAPLVPIVVGGYRQLGALSASLGSDASRPFDRARDGFVIAEGAGIVVLEEREHAIGRGAEILCELAGYGSSCDAGHLTNPDPEGTGPIRAVHEALSDAGAQPKEVGYVNAHATSTPVGDLAEARAITKAGLSAAVSATKSMTGHALGGAGGVEAVITCLAIHKGMLPPTAHTTDPDVEQQIDHILSCSQGTDRSRPLELVRLRGAQRLPGVPLVDVMRPRPRPRTHHRALEPGRK